MSHPSRLLAFVAGQLWAIRPDVGAQLAAVVRRHASGARLDAEEIRERIGSREEREPPERRWDPETGEFYAQVRHLSALPTVVALPAPNGLMPDPGAYYGIATGAPMRKGGGVIAVLSVHGIISPRASMVDDVSPGTGTSLEQLSRRFDAAEADPAVKGVLFDHHSPGGNTIMVTEFVAKLRAARGTKPVWHVANGGMCSASYWIGSQADKGGLFGSPSSEEGSIGVLSVHEDISEALSAEGVKVSLLFDGENKVHGNPFEPLSAAARDSLMAKITTTADVFRADVAKGRGISVETVRKSFGQGATFFSAEAARIGMIDGVATFEEVLKRLARGPVAQVAVPGQAAQSVVETLAAADLTPPEMLGLAQVAEAMRIEEEAATLGADMSTGALVSVEPFDTDAERRAALSRLAGVV